MTALESNPAGIGGATRRGAPAGFRIEREILNSSKQARPAVLLRYRLGEVDLDVACFRIRVGRQRRKRFIQLTRA